MSGGETVTEMLFSAVFLTKPISGKPTLRAKTLRRKASKEASHAPFGNGQNRPVLRSSLSGPWGCKTRRHPVLLCGMATSSRHSLTLSTSRLPTSSGGWERGWYAPSDQSCSDESALQHLKTALLAG